MPVRGRPGFRPGFVRWLSFPTWTTVGMPRKNRAPCLPGVVTVSINTQATSATTTAIISTHRHYCRHLIISKAQAPTLPSLSSSSSTHSLCLRLHLLNSHHNYERATIFESGLHRRKQSTEELNNLLPTIHRGNDGQELSPRLSDFQVYTWNPTFSLTVS